MRTWYYFTLFVFVANRHSAAFALPKTRSSLHAVTAAANRDPQSQLYAISASSEEAVAVPRTKGGDATIASSTFNLAKSMIGAGVLSLPSGVAFFADEPSALIPAGILCTFMGLVAAYSFSLIGKACEQHNVTSFQEVWAKSVNPKSAWVISSSITALCFLASLAFTIIIGDSFAALAQSFNFPALLASRNNVIIAISTFILFPLCSLNSLNALAPFSLLGLAGTLYTAVFMAIRYFDKSYLPGGQFFSTIATTARPSFGQRGGYAVNHLIFILVSMLSTSYVAHFNAPKFYSELKDTSMPRFNTVVGTAFFFSIITFLFMMSVGFLTFGGASAGFVLNNYSGLDPLASLARFAIGLALLTGYPFPFAALRDGVLDISKAPAETRAKLSRPVTIGLLGLLTGLALVLKDVGFVVSIGGAMFGSAVMFIVPAMMNICNAKKAVAPAKASGKLEIIGNYGMIGMGFIMAVIGVAISILRELGKI